MTQHIKYTSQPYLFHQANSFLTLRNFEVINNEVIEVTVVDPGMVFGPKGGIWQRKM